MRFDPLALSERPEHSYLIAGIINMWSYIEAALGSIMSDVMAPNTNIAAAMYSAFQSFQTQRVLLDTVMKDRLSPINFELYSVLMITITPLARDRHNFAHRLLGISSDLPDAVLLVEAQELWKARASAMEASFKRLYDGDVEWTRADPFVLDRSKVSVYKIQDLNEVINDMLFAIRLLERFRLVVTPTRIGPDDTPERRGEQYCMLCSEPRIQEALQRIRGKKS